MAQLCAADTPLGRISYELTRKPIKNANLRVREGRVLLSVPVGVSDRQARELIQSRAAWILRALDRQDRAEKVPLAQLPRQQCGDILYRALERVYPLARELGVAMPELRLRKMRSQWGNCHYRQGYITLNTALASCPEELQDYVALHELIHFIHPDHGLGFYALMDRLMPGWKQRRRALKDYRL